MKVPAKRLPLHSGGHDVVVLGKKFAAELDLHPMDRVLVRNPADESKWVTAHLNFWYETNPVVGLFGDTFDKLGIKNGDEVSLFPAPKPGSVNHIIRKMDRQQLSEEEIFEIVRDIVDAKLTDLEIASFITSTYMAGTTLDETYYLTKAIAETGDMLSFETDIVADKHCSGSVPGNRTTPIVVPAVAALGITIPKSSSRSITSPAGTADVMEVLCRVTFTKEEIRDIVSKTNGCIIWGGGLKIAPADAKLITVRKPLKADPEGLLISSILSKKYAMGATHIMLDIPLGLETRYNNIGEAKLLERELIQIASRLGMKAAVVISDGDEPIGQGVGPVLEAMDVIKVLRSTPDAPADLREKALMVGGKLLELIGMDRFDYNGTGAELMAGVIDSGKAYEKFREIIAAQEGNPEVSLDDLRKRLATHTFDIVADKSGMIIDIQNQVVAKVARIAGAPQNHGCGIFFHHKFEDMVAEGEILATVYCGNPDKLRRARRILNSTEMIFIR
ncbi:MAG: thymidine phosphorylase [Candidatus Thermoplasmatota archaeon]|nr:thymidine phosphorylase [Candidatus Thermoplasmatota archaeon]MDP7264874.1 thymidine phosphorylase [Candidatus Thermoplasmatota archaeon]